MLIYLITDLKNNKKYVGQTTCSLEKRWREHVYAAHGDRTKSQFPLYHAIRKYGVESFSVQTIDTADSQEDLNKKEIYYISQYKTLDKKFGYNRHGGGHLPIPSTPEGRKKAGLSLRGRKFTAEHRLKISEANKGNANFLGHHHSEETRQKMSEIHKERCRKNGGSRLGLKSSPEHIEKIRIANTGKKHTAETKAKISRIKTNPSAEIREKLRQSHLGKPWSEARILAHVMKTVAWG